MLQGKNPILGIILLFFFSLPSFAQNASNILEGTVRDIKGKPIDVSYGKPEQRHRFPYRPERTL